MAQVVRIRYLRSVPKSQEGVTYVLPSSKLTVGPW